VVVVPPPGPSCKKASECASEAGQCLAEKLASRGDGTSEQRYFIEYDANGVPRIVRYTHDIPSEKNEAEAGECAAELQSCLAETC
jgi:hypothetical protein